MDISITRQQIGLLLTVAGSAALAFSIRTNSQYGGELADVVKKAKKDDPDLFEPSEAFIVRGLFWSGLILIGVGALLQW